MNKTLAVLVLFLSISLAVTLVILRSVFENVQSSPVVHLRSPFHNITAFRSFGLTDRDCKRYDFKQLRRTNNSNGSPPIYDFFLFHNELDMLEIRLYELYNYVTLFLVVESRTTLSGKPKPLYLKENWQKFKKYHHKIRRFEVDLDEKPKDQWTNEAKIRQEGLRLALCNQTNDILLLTSDVDEIPTAHFMQILSKCQLPSPFPSLTLVCAFYYYSFEFRRIPGASAGPTVSWLSMNRANQSAFPSGKSLRNERFNYQHMPSACYHCSWCFNRIHLTRTKMASYSHTEHNRIHFHTQEHILTRYRHGKDLFDRAGEKYVRVKNNDEIPELVKIQRERFDYLTNRSAMSNVGFIDLKDDDHPEKHRRISHR